MVTMIMKIIQQLSFDIYTQPTRKCFWFPCANVIGEGRHRKSPRIITNGIQDRWKVNTKTPATTWTHAARGCGKFKESKSLQFILPFWLINIKLTIASFYVQLNCVCVLYSTVVLIAYVLDGTNTFINYLDQCIETSLNQVATFRFRYKVWTWNPLIPVNRTDYGQDKTNTYQNGSFDHTN